MSVGNIICYTHQIVDKSSEIIVDHSVGSSKVQTYAERPCYIGMPHKWEQHDHYMLVTIYHVVHYKVINYHEYFSFLDCHLVHYPFRKYHAHCQLMNYQKPVINYYALYQWKLSCCFSRSPIISFPIFFLANPPEICG